MRFGQFFLLVLICWNVSCSLYSDDDRLNHGYPYNIGVPSILHKYDIDDPESVIKAKRVFEDNRQENDDDDIDYGTFEENESYRDYERGYSNWYLRSYDESSNGYQDNKICETNDCHNAAAEIKNGLDTSADPCQDFDQFACGGWRSRNPIPKSQSQWTQFMKLWHHEETLLKDVIERQANSSENSSAALIYSWYSSCLNETERKQSGDKPLLGLILELGSSSVITPFTWFPFGWMFVDHVVLLNRLAIHPFFLVTPRNDLLNSSRVLLTFSPSKTLLGSPNFYFGKGTYYKDVRYAYIKLMIHLIIKLRRSFGMDRINSVYSFRNQIANIFKLEYYIARVLYSKKKTTYHIMSLNRLQREIPWFPWKLYIHKLYFNVKQKKPITGNEMIAIFRLNVLKKITRILKLTPKSIKANFLMWNIAYQFTGDISADYETVRHRFVVAMYGDRQRKARWRECVSSTSAALSMAVGKLFVEETFDEHSKMRAEKIIEDIRQQLIKDFENISWMDKDTTKNAEEKAKAILKNIGFPKFVLNETLVRYYYAGMSFHPEKFLNNIILRRLIISHNTLTSREVKPDRQRWSMAPQQINAYYSQEFNKIVFPAGILQPPFWHASYPMSIQYGGLGFVVGHEISHGFDVNGMHYDKNGNYIGWWTNSSKNAFKLKSHCLSGQYSNYTVFGKNINGVTTLGENIADNGGIRLAYKAYKEWKKNNGTNEKTLPGLPFSHDQLFFLKGAQLWCANIRKKVALNMIDTDPHTLKMFRIIGPFSNSVAFSKAFKCPSGSRMNPVKKCRVW
ncbi:endothelin-converting enzyme homolog [Paramuricea clavata]|uniref:Endothelin-converting enzyme homolog n=1 Tax=Paramuricea clavata TaxID=317549 RepID=A0A6S7H998_PARCT|nr:endothelin-converting enzyme homolog [Paramuricea clavata]